jgi:hypothetical protein
MNYSHSIMMSTNNNEAEAADMSCCASCGIAEVDGVKVKLKQCACKLVRYCSVACQKEHRSQHKNVCKKQVAELRDEILFKQPESSHLKTARNQSQWRLPDLLFTAID